MSLLAPPPLTSHRLHLPFLSFPMPTSRPLRRGDLVIRMGGGPRTFPGGVSKWQWKRMQARKAKQLLKARLARERQLYEMRKRAELRDAVIHLERPWEPDSASAITAAPNLLSVAADDQLKALADRFHRPGGVDLWNDRDGPQVFASPDTGRTSARFFPKDAVHSVQPYARLGAGSGSAQDVSGDRKELAKDSQRTQGVRGNAAVRDMYGDYEPTVEFMERDGMWEPVTALDDRDEHNSSDSSWNGDNDVFYDTEGMEDVNFEPEGRAVVRRNGRKGSVARWKVANPMAVGTDEDGGRRGHGLFPDFKGAREGHLEQKWSERNSGDRRKRPTAIWKASNTKSSNATEKDYVGGGSFSDSEVIRGGSQPKWRARRNREETVSGEGKWKLSYDSFGNVTRKEWIHGESDSNSESGRDGQWEPKWKDQNRFSQSENLKGQHKQKYRPGANNREKPGRYMRADNGDGRDRFGNGFASDLEEPTWKPRRNSEARNSNGRSEHNDDTSRRFRRGGSGASRRSGVHPMINMNGEDGSRHTVFKSVGRRFSGDGYSLRPTSELHSSWRERESDGM